MNPAREVAHAGIGASKRRLRDSLLCGLAQELPCDRFVPLLRWVVAIELEREFALLMAINALPSSSPITLCALVCLDRFLESSSRGKLSASNDGGESVASRLGRVIRRGKLVHIANPSQTGSTG